MLESPHSKFLILGPALSTSCPMMRLLVISIILQE